MSYPDDHVPEGEADDPHGRAKNGVNHNARNPSFPTNDTRKTKEKLERDHPTPDHLPVHRYEEPSKHTDRVTPADIFPDTVTVRRAP